MLKKGCTKAFPDGYIKLDHRLLSKAIKSDKINLYGRMYLLMVKNTVGFHRSDAKFTLTYLSEQLGDKRRECIYRVRKSLRDTNLIEEVDKDVYRLIY